MKYLLALVFLGLLAVANQASAQFYYSASNGDTIYSLAANGTSTAYVTNSALADAVAITADSSGNLYVAIGNGGTAVTPDAILEVAAGTQAVTTFATIPNTFGSGVNPTSLSYYSGSVYALDAGNNTITKFSSNGATSSTFGYATYSFGLTFDSSGTAYTAGYGNSYSGELDKDPQPSSGTATQTVLASNLNNSGGFPQAVAVSPLNNDIYVAMGGGGGTKILQFAGSGSSYTQSTFATVSGSPLALAINPSGDIFSLNSTSSNTVTEYSPTGTLLETVSLSGAYPTGIVYVPAAVPEPSTWALTVVGLFGLGAIAAYRRKLGLI